MKIVMKIAAACAAVSMVFGLSGCNEVKNAENTLNSAMESLQKGDFISAAQYIEFTGDSDQESQFAQFEENQDTAAALFSKMTYTINSSEKTDSSNVKMNVTVTNADMKTVFSNVISDMFSIALSNAFASEEEQLSDEEMQNKIFELLKDGINDENVQTVTNTVDVNVTKTDGGWKVQVDSDVLDAATGGLVSTAESMGSVFGE